MVGESIEMNSSFRVCGREKGFKNYMLALLGALFLFRIVLVENLFSSGRAYANY